MRMRAQPSGLKAAMELEDLQSIVVYDDFDNPILVIKKLETGQILSSGIHEGADFKKLLDSLGIGLNAKCEKLRVS